MYNNEISSYVAVVAWAICYCVAAAPVLTAAAAEHWLGLHSDHAPRFVMQFVVGSAA